MARPLTLRERTEKIRSGSDMGARYGEEKAKEYESLGCQCKGMAITSYGVGSTTKTEGLTVNKKSKWLEKQATRQCSSKTLL